MNEQETPIGEKVNIFRTIKTENPFAQIDKRLINDKTISWKTKGILIYLLSKPNDWIAKIDDIIGHATEGRDAVRTAIQEAIKAGYILKKQSHDENGKFTNVEYQVFEQPTKSTADGFSAYGKTVDGKTAYGKSDTTNNEYTNNEYTNNKKETNKDINIYIKGNSYPEKIKEIISYLNQKAETNYKTTTNQNIKLITARLNEGFTIEDFKKVIDNKIDDWAEDDKYCKYLRPLTLFGNKFESYLNQKNANDPYDDFYKYLPKQKAKESLIE